MHKLSINQIVMKKNRQKTLQTASKTNPKPTKKIISVYKLFSKLLYVYFRDCFDIYIPFNLIFN